MGGGFLYFGKRVPEGKYFIDIRLTYSRRYFRSEQVVFEANSSPYLTRKQGSYGQKDHANRLNEY